jgi:hypothetical protein
MWFPVLLLSIGFILLLLFFLYMHNDVGTIKLFLENDHFLTVRQELDSLKALTTTLESRIRLLDKQPIHRSDLDKKCIKAAQTLVLQGYVKFDQICDRDREEIWRVIRGCFDDE